MRHIDSPRSKRSEGESIHLSERGVGSILNTGSKRKLKLTAAGRVCSLEDTDQFEPVSYVKMLLPRLAVMQIIGIR